MRTRERLLLIGLALGLGAACAHKKFVEVSCGLADPPSAMGPVPASMDLTAARAFYDYLAVTKVEPAGEHFTVWYVDMEPVFERLLVKRKPEGGVAIESEGAVFGGIGGPPPAEPWPPEIAAMARELEASLRKRCPQGREWHVRYAGHNRTVTVREFVAHDSRGHGTWRAGWFATLTVAMDEGLNGIDHTIEQSSGFGRIEVPEGAQWIEVPQGGRERLRLAEALSPELEKSIATAARRMTEGQPGPALGSLVPANAPLLPTGFVARVIAKLTIFGGTPSEVSVPLEVRDAVFGPGAKGAAAFRGRDRNYSIHIELAPHTLLMPSPERRSTRYLGTLQVRIQNDAGRKWERSYPVNGDLETENHMAVMPTGLPLPGASAPSPEEQALRIELDGGIEARMGVELFDDPRRP